MNITTSPSDTEIVAILRTLLYWSENYIVKTYVKKHFSDEDDGEYQPASKEIDSSYSDPLGPMPDRPRTSVGGRGNLDDDFADEEIGDDLLPE